MISMNFNSYARLYFSSFLFFFCFVFENETLYTIQVLAVFDFYYGEDLSCCQFCQCFKSAACVIIGNYEKS